MRAVARCLRLVLLGENEGLSLCAGDEGRGLVRRLLPKLWKRRKLADFTSRLFSRAFDVFQPQQ